MKLLIKLAILSVFCCSTAFSQVTDTISVQKNQTAALFEVGINRTTALGDNFLNDAYKLRMGFEMELDFILKENYLLGLRYELFGAKNEKPGKVGSHKRTNIHTITGNAGYIYKFSEEINLSGIAGLGWGIYNNRYNSDVKFYDQSAVLSLQLKVGFNFSANFGMYGAVKYRHDFMTIETAPELEDYFNEAQMIGLSIGVRFF